MEIRFSDILGLSPAIMAMLVAFLLGVVEFGIFIKLPLWILPLLYVFWITSNYFVEIVEHRALGHSDWPVFSQETLVAGRSQAGIGFFLCVLVAAGACGALAYFDQGDLAALLLVPGLVLLPAAVALLAVTRELSAALNPLRVLATAVAMGPAYLLCLLACGALFGIGLIALEGMAFYWYPPAVYAVFLLAWLIGSAAFARRNALGIRALRSPEALADRERAGVEKVRREILSQAYGFATRGNRAGALKHIEAYINADEDSAEARLWMLNSMLQWEDSAVPLEFGRQVIEYCEQSGLAAEAQRVRLHCEHLSSRRQVP